MDGNNVSGTTDDRTAVTVRCIEGEKLTTWAVLPGGQHVSSAFPPSVAPTHRIVLPIEALTGLLMTLPRMVRSALDERFPGGSLRLVHPLGDWRLEQAEGDNGLILKLGTSMVSRSRSRFRTRTPVLLARPCSGR